MAATLKCVYCGSDTPPPYDGEPVCTRCADLMERGQPPRKAPLAKTENPGKETRTASASSYFG